MKTSRTFAAVLCVALFLSGSAVVAAAADPPGRAVDIKYISGQVSLQQGGVNDWVAAVVNRPLTTADRVWADKDSRAELHLGSAALRMGAETSLTLTNVSDQTVQVELDQGALNLWVRHLFDGEIYEVDTPNLAFTITRSGDYRFDVDPSGVTRITVRHGEGEATGQGNAVKVGAGEQVSFSNGTSLEHQISDAPPPDGFDDWCRVRDERAEHSPSARYVSPDVPGGEDLDDYGHWQQTPAYGSVWVPSAVAPGWAPYHYGHWVWVAPWGWTWVDDAPWGYAPAHYGRWVFFGGVWGWAPGPVVVGVAPIYAPALVGWVGGPGWGVGIGFGVGFGVVGGVGWFPLGFGEPFVPGYAVSRGYFQNVNVTNTHITNITNVTNNYYNNTNNVQNINYANRSVPGATTAVSRNVMENGQPVGKSAVSVPVSEAMHAPIATAAPVAPSKNSVLGVNAGAHAAAPPAPAVSRPVVSKSPPPPKPVPFEAQQAALAKNPGRPLDPQTEQQIRSRLPQQNAQGSNGPGTKGDTNPGAGRPAPPTMGGQPAGNNAARSVPRPPTPGQVNPGQANNAPGDATGARPVPRPPQPGQANNAPNNNQQLDRPSDNRANPGGPEGAANAGRNPATDGASQSNGPANRNAARTEGQSRSAPTPGGGANHGGGHPGAHKPPHPPKKNGGPKHEEPKGR